MHALKVSLHSFCDTHSDACQLQLELKTMFNVVVYAYFIYGSMKDNQIKES